MKTLYGMADEMDTSDFFLAEQDNADFVFKSKDANLLVLDSTVQEQDDRYDSCVVLKNLETLFEQDNWLKYSALNNSSRKNSRKGSLVRLSGQKRSGQNSRLKTQKSIISF